MHEMKSFVDRYVAVWNEPDQDARRKAVSGLWAEDGVELTESSRYQGHVELEARVAEAHEEFVRAGGFLFVAADDATGHHGTVNFTTHMVPAAGGAPVWTGRVFVLLGEDGRIATEYQATVHGGTRAAVEEFLRRSGEGDPDRIAALYADQVDWRVSWPVDDHPAVPWLIPRSTRSDVVGHFVTFGQTCVPQEGAVTVERVVVEGDEAVLTGLSAQTVRTTGRRFAMRFALHLTFENGVITRHHMYEDSLAVREAFD
ncbi:nuclear transport factor 2 family protein [Streptomyces sp. PU-14G]|uniref:nuclear transport factor 2 family protein n=1 Tax=Streptomyces sp. PU-14G TaxID=2800808 RepID=UPI0034DEBF74